MADSETLKQIGNRSAGVAAPPVPQLQIVPLPAKLRSIDPAGCEAWEKEMNAKLARWIQSVNQVNRDFGVAIQS